MAYKIPIAKKKEMEKIYGVMDGKKPFSIDENNYGWERERNGTMRVRLGNMSDAGWYWDGDQNDLNGFIFRLNHSQIKDDFLKDTTKNNITFAEIKAQLLKSSQKMDGFYEMSGDNVVWKFGETDGDVDEAYEMEEAGLTKEQENKVYSEYKPVSYEEFEKENAEFYKKSMNTIIVESNSYEEYMEKQEDVSAELQERRMNENQNRFLQAIDKVKEKK